MTNAAENSVPHVPKEQITLEDLETAAIVSKGLFMLVDTKIFPESIHTVVIENLLLCKVIIHEGNVYIQQLNGTLAQLQKSNTYTVNTCVPEYADGAISVEVKHHTEGHITITPKVLNNAPGLRVTSTTLTDEHYIRRIERLVRRKERKESCEVPAYILRSIRQEDGRSAPTIMGRIEDVARRVLDFIKSI